MLNLITVSFPTFNYFTLHFFDMVQTKHGDHLVVMMLYLFIPDLSSSLLLVVNVSCVGNTIYIKYRSMWTQDHLALVKGSLKFREV